MFWDRVGRARLFTIMEPRTTVLLKPGEADRVVAGHPWVYHSSVLRFTQPAADGALVQVKDHRQRFLGVGFYNSKSKIQVRMLAPERVEVDQRFFEERIGQALKVRKKHLPQATSFRVVNAESDFLSGLIIGRYEDVLVLQISSIESGLLHPGQILYFAKTGMRAKILANGHIRSGKMTGSLHAVAKSLMNDAPINGWEVWYYKDKNGNKIVIDELRKKFQVASRRSKENR